MTTTTSARLRCVVAIGALSLIASPARVKAQAVTDALVATSKAVMVPIDRFRPDVAVPDTVFECRPPRIHVADLMLPVNAIEYSANVPNSANSVMSMVVFADSTGKLIRFAERRGDPVRPDLRGLAPAQIGHAIQTAALRSRSTSITVDYRGHRGSAMNRGGVEADVMTTDAPEIIANLDALGKPGEFASRVVAVCGGRKP